MFVLGSAAGSGLVFAAGDTWLSVLAANGTVAAEAPLRPSDTAVAVAKGGRYFAASSPNNSVRLESLRPEDPLTPRLGLDDATAFGWPIDWSENGQRVAIGTQEGEVSVFDPTDPEAGAKVWRYVFPAMIRAVEFDPAGRWVWAAGSSGQVARIDARDPSADIDYSVQFDGVIRDLELSPDGKHLAVAATPGAGVLVMPPDLDGFEQAEEVDGLAAAWLGPRRLLVASGTAEGSDRSEPVLRTFDPELEPVGGITPSPSNGFIALRAHEGRVAAVGGDGLLELYGVGGERPRVLGSAPTGNGLATDVAWSADGTALAVVGDSSRVTFFDPTSLEEIGTQPIGDSGGGTAAATHAGTLATLPLGKAVAKLVPFGVSAWAQEICDRTRLFLSPAEWVELVGPWPPYRQPCRPPR
jgi:WD40 repeat protein